MNQKAITETSNTMLYAATLPEVIALHHIIKIRAFGSETPGSRNESEVKKMRNESIVLAAEAKLLYTKWGIFPNVDSAVFGMFFWAYNDNPRVCHVIQRAKTGLLSLNSSDPGMEAEGL